MRRLIGNNSPWTLASAMKLSRTVFIVCVVIFALSAATPLSPCMSKAAIDSLFVQVYRGHELGMSTVGKCFSGTERSRFNARFGCDLARKKEDCAKCVSAADVRNALTECENLVRNHVPRHRSWK